MTNLEKIRRERPEVAKLVMERYPRNKAERRGCETEKAKRDHMRLLMAKRIISEGETKEKVEYQTK